MSQIVIFVVSQNLQLKNHVKFIVMKKAQLSLIHFILNLKFLEIRLKAIRGEGYVILTYLIFIIAVQLLIA